MKKAFALTLIITLFSNSVLSQVLFDGAKSYYNYKAEINELIENETLDDKSIKKANRLDWMYNDRLYPNGDLMSYQKDLRKSIERFNLSDTLNDYEWRQIGNGQIISPKTGRNFGNGRVSFIKFHPTDLNRIYVGSPGGCVWVSYNNGETWEVLSSVPSCRGFSDMHFDVINNNIYLLSGDFDGRVSPFHGLYKSSNDGLTWEILDGPNISYAKKILSHPVIANHHFLLADRKLYISTTTETSWNEVSHLTDVQDFEFAPETDSLMYVFAHDTLYSSHNLGESFTISNTQLDTLRSARSELEIVKIEDRTIIYIATSPTYSASFLSFDSPGIFKSSDHGNSFEMILGSDSLRANQQTYNFLFAAHPTFEDQIFVGWVSLFWNDPTSQTWSKGFDINNFEFHGDQHSHAYDPKAPNCLLVGNDGGIYRTCDLGITWENISGNLQLGQIYHFNNSNTCEDLIISGLQDNGSAVLHDDAWKKIGGGDGLSNGFSANSNDTIFHSSQSGSLFRIDSLTSILESTSFEFYKKQISPIPATLSQSFNNRFESSSVKPGLCYYKDSYELYKTTNSGEDWQLQLNPDSIFWDDYNFISYDLFLSAINADVAVISNLEIIFTDSTSQRTVQIRYTTDEGLQWITKTINHISIDTFINKPRPSAVACSEDASKIWVGLNSNNFHRILSSSDSGDSWIDYSEGLPNIQINDLIHQPYSNDGLYLANDIGVYFRNDTMSAWQCVSANIPPTLFTELRISNVAQKLRASTFGYGMWETDLIHTELTPPFANMDCSVVELCVDEEYVLRHNSTYEVLHTEWLVANGTLNNASVDSVIVSFSEPGFHNALVVVTNNNGADTFKVNGKFLVHDDRIPIDSIYLGNETFSLSVPESFTNIFWSTADTASTITVHSGGWYYVEGVNENDCVVKDSIFLNTTTNTIEIIDKECKVFPNPSIDGFTIDCSNHKRYIQISNIVGETMEEYVSSERHKVYLREGIYLVTIKDLKGRVLENHKVFVIN